MIPAEVMPVCQYLVLKEFILTSYDIKSAKVVIFEVVTSLGRSVTIHKDIEKMFIPYMFYNKMASTLQTTLNEHFYKEINSILYVCNT
jgi:hypothetical protein